MSFSLEKMSIPYEREIEQFCELGFGQGKALISVPVFHV
ncbi:hypothetical protein BSM4216_0332 [Bacillus smithii]|nr:hypothetical protein BSM4216_0332 [Bacillus smithii]